MNFNFTKFFLLGVALAGSSPMLAQVDYSKYPDYSAILKKDVRLLHVRPVSEEMPSHVNNSTLPYFPPIFNQDGGSCGSASRVNYMFNYEIDAYRRVNARKPENQYPSHFTWLLTFGNSGKGVMLQTVGVPNVVTYGGRTYSHLFGNQDAASSDFGWMQGYDKWYSAMFNRLWRTANFPLSVETEEGRNAVKHWIWNHNGDPDFHGVGGICGIGVASGGNWQPIPKSPSNDKLGFTGQKYVKAWGKSIDHALTIVGYDDRVQFDLDGDGVVGGKDEVGAWIIANSWGSWWCNQGFVYCPYKNAVTAFNPETHKGNGQYYYPEIYYIRKSYRPFRTFKIKMEYSRRSELFLQAGVAQDTSAIFPERTINMEHFKNAGNGAHLTPDPEVPMLGRWKDGMHYEPMEFGYDLTDLTSSFDTRKPLKYFFIIKTKKTAQGVGKVDALSLMTYEFNEKGVEVPFPISSNGVQIRNHGNTTVISYVVMGETLNAPENVALRGNNLTWGAPLPGGYNLIGFSIYNGKDKLVDLDKSIFSYTIPPTAQNDISIVAKYDMSGKTVFSTSVMPEITSYDGSSSRVAKVKRFTPGGFNIKNVFEKHYEKATIEFWIKPLGSFNYNQRIGPGWGRFLFHTTNTHNIVVGWKPDADSRLETPEESLPVNKWTHVAIVVNDGQLSVYLNGELAKTMHSSWFHGIGGFKDLIVGTDDGQGLNGFMDEFRVWSVARSKKEIQRYLYSQFKNPSHVRGLLAEVTMDTEGNGFKDATGHYIVEGLKNATENNPTKVLAFDLNDQRSFNPAFIIKNPIIRANELLQIINSSGEGAISYKWKIEGTGASVDSSQMSEPKILFSAVGKKKITLTTYNALGESKSYVKEIDVQKGEAPIADFTFDKNISVGENITFVNKTTPSEGTRYEWSSPDSRETSAHVTNFSTSFSKPGNHTVILKATNANGTSVCTKSVYIKYLKPKANFQVNNSVIYKGGTVNLIDQSTKNPQIWHWNIVNNANFIVKETRNAAVVLNHSGKYDVMLIVHNRTGNDTLISKKAIVVCNADSKSGLNFGGSPSETVTFKNPISKDAEGFTMEWWMYSKGSVMNINGIGMSSDNFLLQTKPDGAFFLKVAGNRYSTNPDIVETNAWHHYAIVYKAPNLMVYKDCKLVNTLNMGSTDIRKFMPANFRFGGSEAPMNAILDEFRIWNKPLTAEELRKYANAPIENVAQAEQQDNLALYYDFNQNGGDVMDRTSNHDTGVRTGFGPDGDAWGSSLGVFSLSDEDCPDVTSKYMTNCQAPFLHTDNKVNSIGSNYMELEQGTPKSGWIMQNATEINNVTTGFYVYTRDNQDVLKLTTGLYGFDKQVKDLKLYQTVKLPAGHYEFNVEGDNLNRVNNSYIVIAKGTGLPVTDDIAKSIAYTDLGNGSLEFTLAKEQTVSIGLLVNYAAHGSFTINKFFLGSKHTNDDYSFTSIPGVRTGNGTANAIYDLSGRRVEKPSAGLYIVNGKKVFVE